MNACPLCAKNAALTTENLFPTWMQISDTPHLLLCQTCQKRFARNSNFTVEFFKERKFLRKTVEPDYYETFFGVEYHHKSARTALLYFVVGLALKQHLILTAQGEDLLGASFDRLAQDFNGHFLEENDYPLVVLYQSEHSANVTTPQRTRLKNLNAIESCILGYRFFLITDQRTLPAESPVRKLAQATELTIIQIDSSEDVWKDFEDSIEQLQIT